MPDQYTQWHQIFGSVLEEVLTPVGITVQTEVDVSSSPPQIDILLLQRQQASSWTDEQRRYLPDGIRDSQASHILLEFKYTESVNEDAIRQILGYDTFYRRARKQLSSKEVQSFIVSAKTPRPETLTRFGYQHTEQVGIYQSDNVLLQTTPLLVLNELDAAPHNLFFKLFASRIKEKTTAVTELQKWGTTAFSVKLYWLIRGLLKLWLMKGEEIMEEAITVESLMEEGKLFKDLVLPMFTTEEIKTVLRDTPYGQQIREEGREEGREAMIKTLSRILVIRFAVDMDYFIPRFEQLSLSNLEALGEPALTIDSLADFEAVLNSLLL